MKQLIAISALAALNWIVALVCALESGPVALTVGAAITGVFTQLAVLAMIVYNARD